MAYIEPVTRADGFKISASVWNQDVVENTKAIKALTDVAPTVIVEKVSSTLTLTSGVWNTRHLNETRRDPNGIITSNDYPNYRFSLSDGTYLVDIWTQLYVNNHAGWYGSRLFDTSNNTTIVSTNLNYLDNDSSGTGRDTNYMHTFWEFTLFNSAPTTLELQTRYNGSSGSVLYYDITTYDPENNAGIGVYDSIIKLWKVG